jgi:cytochrome c55X
LRNWMSVSCTALSAAVLAASAMAVLAGSTPEPGRQSALLHLVRHDCGSCHGLTLRGGLGRPLLPDALDGLGAEQIADVILDGVPGTPMPPWRGELTRDEAVWIARRLKEGLEE